MSRKRKSGFTRMTEGEWRLIRSVLESGKPLADVAKLAHRSYPTVNTVKRSTSFKNYKQILNAYIQAHLARSAGKTTTEGEQVSTSPPTVVTNGDLVTILRQLRNSIIELEDYLTRPHS